MNMNTNLILNNGNIIFSVEGNIGSGKTTLLEELTIRYSNSKNIIILQEPVGIWEQIKDENDTNILEKFYDDQNKYSFPFQVLAFISRLSILKKACETNKNAIIITERSLFTDKLVFAKMLYDEGKIEYICYQIYLKWFDEFVNDFPIHKVIYIKTSPEKCAERITKRSRKGESLIPLDYLKKCDNYHDNMMNELNCESIILDGNEDIYGNEKILDEWIRQINIEINDK